MAAQPHTENPHEEPLPATALYQFTVGVDDADGCVRLEALDVASSRRFLLVVKPDEVVPVSAHLCVTSQELAGLLKCAIASQGGASLSVLREEQEAVLVCTLALETMFSKRTIELNLIFQPPQDQVLLLTQRVAALTLEVERLQGLVCGSSSSSSSSSSSGGDPSILLLVNLTSHPQPTLVFPEIPPASKPHVTISANLYTNESHTKEPTIAPHSIEIESKQYRCIIDLRWELDGPRALFWADEPVPAPSRHSSVQLAQGRPTRQRSLWDDWKESRKDTFTSRRFPSVIGWFSFEGCPKTSPVKINTEHELYAACKTKLALIEPFLVNDLKNLDSYPSLPIKCPAIERFQTWTPLLSLGNTPLICTQGNRIVFANPCPFGVQRPGQFEGDLRMPGSSELMWQLMFEIAEKKASSSSN